MVVHTRVRSVVDSKEILPDTVISFPNSSPQYYAQSVNIVKPGGDIPYNHIIYVANPSNVTNITLSVRNDIEMFGDTVQAEIYNVSVPKATYTAFSGTAWTGCFTDIGGNLLDESTDINDTTGAKDVTFAFNAVNDAIYFGAAIPFSRARFNIDTIGNYVGTFAIEYWNGSAWVSFTNIYDGTAAAVNKPFTKLGSQYMQWNMPTDWVAAIPVAGGPVSQYWMRVRVATLTSVTTNFTLESGLYKATGDANVHAYIVPGMFVPGDVTIALRLETGLTATQGFNCEIEVQGV